MPKGKYTDLGCQVLGALVRKGIESKDWGQVEVVGLMQKWRDTRPDELSRFLNARSGRPDGTLIVALWRLNVEESFLPRKSSDELFSLDDLFAIACEDFDSIPLAVLQEIAVELPDLSRYCR